MGGILPRKQQLAGCLDRSCGTLDPGLVRPHMEQLDQPWGHILGGTTNGQGALGQGERPKGQACKNGEERRGEHAGLPKRLAFTAHTCPTFRKPEGLWAPQERPRLDPRVPRDRMKSMGPEGLPRSQVSSKNEKALDYCKVFHLQTRHVQPNHNLEIQT